MSDISIVEQATSNKGAGYGSVTLNDTSSGTRIVDLGIETESIAIKAVDGKIYIGFDDQVDDTNGYPLDEGQGISFDLDVDQDGLFAFPETSGNEVRWIALG